jgi:predicted metal-binding protein
LRTRRTSLPSPWRKRSNFMSDLPLRSYPARWKGPVLLACRKCQKKLGHHDGSAPLRKLKKSLKAIAKDNGDRQPIHVISVPCLKLCPKGAVTVCTQQELTRTPTQLTLIRSKEDLVQLHLQLRR